MLTAEAFSNVPGVLAAADNAKRNLLPPPDMLPSEWAEKNIVVPIGNAVPGPLSFANAPYQRGMLDAIHEPGVRRISFMTGAQLGKTTVQQCISGYFIAHEPRSQIFVTPTEGDMKTFVETKLRPMFEANKSISDKMAKQRGRDGVNNGRIMSYIGGWLMFSWAGSPKTLRGRSAPITQADEVDGYEATPEGDPGELLAQRAATFGDMAIRTESSTPTVKGASRIETAFEAGDQRRYYIPCPDCNEPQYLRWENVTWTGRRSTGVKDAALDVGQEHQPETAMYTCSHCGSLWNDGQRIAAIRNAEKNGYGWKAAKPYRGHITFHAPEMLSTFRRLRAIVQSYLDKLALDDLQSFVNVSLGETHEEDSEKADPTGLLARRENYTHQVPARGLYLTAGIDMQMDRLEVEVVAWGEGEESWRVTYRVLWGDPLGTDVWDELDALLAETFTHASGAQLRIESSCLDTGGTHGYTQRAYEYAKGKTGRRLFAIKGQPGWAIPVVQAPQRRQSGKNARKVDLFLVGVDEAKLIVMRRLGKLPNPDGLPTPGYCHFSHDELDEDGAKQLTAEKLVLRYVKGQPIREWHKPDRARNEQLDCRVYALAALKITQPSFKRLAIKLAVKTSAAPPAPPQEPQEPAPPPIVRPTVVKSTVKSAQAPKEIPQEEAKPAPAQTAPVVKRSKSLAPKRKAGWVSNW